MKPHSCPPIYLAAGIVLALLVAGFGCVIRTEHTIEAHITLDIRHIEDDAEEILKFIDGETNTLSGTVAAPTEEAGKKAGDGSSGRLERILNWLDPMPTAYAAALKEGSPLVKEIAVQLRKRNGAISALKAQGCMGENNRGYVELRDCDGLADSDKRNEAQKLLADENKDRKALHKEIARLNKDQEGLSVGTVERVYAAQRLKRGNPGDIFQLPPAGEYFDDFKDSEQGKALGSECLPEAWVSLR